MEKQADLASGNSSRGRSQDPTVRDRASSGNSPQPGDKLTSNYFASPGGGSDLEVSDHAIPWICFAPGTSPDLVADINAASQRRAGRSPGFDESAFQFFSTARWARTATNQAPTNGPNRLRQGDPVTITWSIIPDGTPIAANGSIEAESSDPSNLIAFLDGIYGDRATWLALIQQVFDRWSEVSGNRYVYEPNDDGASFPNSAGSLGIRGDVRIGGHSIDGGFNTLAYNFGPPNGDMVIDSADTYFDVTSSNSLRFRNVLAHEHGHGLGLAHVCPQNNTKLMEPNATTVFEGPQHDDIFSAQRQYGDRYEDTNEDAVSDDNDAFSRRTELGLLPPGTTRLTPLSIDDSSDLDYLGFTTSTSGAKLSVSLKPLGSSYLEGPQNSDGSCSGGTTFDSKAVHDLGFAVLDSGGSNLVSVDANPAGADETTAGFALPPGTGPFTIRVSGGTADNAQLYELEITLSDPNALPEVSIADAAAPESDGVISFQLSLSASASSPISVDYVVAAVSASEGIDFIADAGTVTFPAGSVLEVLDVSVVDDQLDEADESIRVLLSNPAGAVLGAAEALGTIGDDDDPPAISVSDAQSSEAAGSIEVPLSLSGPSGLTTSVIFSTAAGSAAADVDFVPQVRRIVFAAGETDKSVSIVLNDDGEAEVDEEFSAQLTNPSSASIADGNATLTILDDDALTLLSEGGALSDDSGSGGISITWSAVPGRSYTILYSIDLESWEPVPGAELITADESDESFVHNPKPGSRSFYRIVEGDRPP